MDHGPLALLQGCGIGDGASQTKDKEGPDQNQGRVDDRVEDRDRRFEGDFLRRSEERRNMEQVIGNVKNTPYRLSEKHQEKDDEEITPARAAGWGVDNGRRILDG